MSDKCTLQKEIEKLTARTVPMHMPGHKRMIMPSDRLPYELDITEIQGADDLHDADGILKDAMDRAAVLWKSKRTWFLVGGSTCGILSGIRAAAPFGSGVIVARNCHRSVYHAIELGGYKAHWIIPGQNREFEICLGITAAQVREMLIRHPESAAVIITSPTYEGILSEVRSIAAVCHKAGVPLIVDEAHGAHLGLFEDSGFPKGAVDAGADIVVQSIHKTLPAMTQTALLHLQGDIVAEKEIERQLGIFESSSPSYPLLISIDSCIDLLVREGPELFAQWRQALEKFYERTERLSCIKILRERQLKGRNGTAVSRDPAKILINFSRAGMSGSKAAQILRERYGIEIEMSSGMNVLAMTGCGDGRGSLDRLSDALLHMDRLLLKSAGKAAGGRKTREVMPPVRTSCNILTAVSCPGEELPVSECEGRICGEYLYAYPPGIPILAPGEYIESAHLRIIRQKEADGNTVHHTHSANPGRILCLEE